MVPRLALFALWERGVPLVFSIYVLAAADPRAQARPLTALVRHVPAVRTPLQVHRRAPIVPKVIGVDPIPQPLPHALEERGSLRRARSALIRVERVLLEHIRCRVHRNV